MYNLIKTCITYSRVSFTLFIILIFYGVVSMYTIPKEENPEITAPYIFINVNQDGVLPEDVEKVIVEPIEQEIQDLESLKVMRSISRENGADFFLEFNTDIDIDTALANVRTEIDSVKAKLPADADEPSINQRSFAQFPVISLAISGNIDERLLYQIANDASDNIMKNKDVLSADVIGTKERVTDIVFNSYFMTSYNLTVDGIMNSITSSNRLIATGALQTQEGRVIVKVPSLFKNIQDIADVPLVATSESVIRVKDVAEIRDTFKEPENYARLNGLNTVVIEVVKRPDSNLFHAIKGAQRQLEKYKKTLDNETKSRVNFVWMQDTSKSVMQTIKELANNILLSILLVFCVLYIGLNLRSALIASLGIPSTFFISLGLLNAFGITLNMVVLFALILSVGMIIDATVIVIEYADSQLKKGKTPFQAYSEAGARMFMPLLASTATTVIVFIPLLFWPGVSGQFMSFMPKTLLVLLSVSFFVAVFFITTLGFWFGRASQVSSRAIEDGSILSYKDIENLEGILGSYGRALLKVVKKPHIVVFSILVILYLSNGLYQRFGKGMQFFPSVEPEFLEVLVKLEGNYSIYEQDSIMKFVEDAIPHKEDFASIYTSVGGSARSTDTVGRVTLELAEWGQRRVANVIIKDINKSLSNLKGISYEARKQEQGPSRGKAFVLEIYSNNKANTDYVIAELTEFLQGSEGLMNVADDLPKAVIDLNVEIDKHKAALVGLDIGQIGRFLTMITNGSGVDSYRPDDWSEEVDIRVKFSDDLRNVTNLEEMMINSNNGPIALGTIVDIKEVVSSGFIRHSDGTRAYRIEADLAPGTVLGEEIKRAREFITKSKLDSKTDFRFRGEAEDQGESSSFLALAFATAIAFIALVLLLQFNSFFYTFLILFSVVMSTVGVMLGLIIIRQPFGVVMSGLAIIFLAGIVVNNNIVLIDTFTAIRKQKPNGNYKMAVLRTAIERFRPIMLTSVTTVLGLTPMALKLNIDFLSRNISYNLPSSQWWFQLSSSIVAGMVFSTLLTLFFTPAVLIYYRKLQIAWQRRWRAKLILKISNIYNICEIFIFNKGAVFANLYSAKSNSIAILRKINLFTIKLFNKLKGAFSQETIDFLIKQSVNSGNLPKYKPYYKKLLAKVLIIEEYFYLYISNKVVPSLKYAKSSISHGVKVLTTKIISIFKKKK